MTKKLYRSKKNRWLTGLCGGLGEYFGIDPIIIRIIAIFFACGLLGIVVYFVASVLVPEEQGPYHAEFSDADN